MKRLRVDGVGTRKYLHLFTVDSFELDVTGIMLARIRKQLGVDVLESG